MGFTRYWDIHKSIDDVEFRAATKDITTMLKEEGAWGDVVVYDLDMANRPPMVDEYEIHFNGRGEDGHETFHIDPSGGWGFCKTARKPYDRYVWASLLILQRHVSHSIEISSDGENGDYLALKLADKYYSGA